MRTTLSLILLVSFFATFSSAAEIQPRTRSAVIERIKYIGKSQPAWLNSTPLSYPKTLDLKWSKVKGGWDEQKNLGQYFWSVVRPDPSKWRGAVRLLYHIKNINPGKTLVHRKANNQLAFLFFVLRDYERAAYYIAKKGKPSLNMAHCYWQLGNKDLAGEELKRLSLRDGTYCGAITLWSEMGDFDTAMEEYDKRANRIPDGANNAIGDACRRIGRFDEALKYYTIVQGLNHGSRRLSIQKGRAKSGIEAMRAVKGVDFAKLTDGTYKSSANGYKGEIEIELVVKNQSMKEIRILDTQDDQPLDALEEMPKRLIKTGDIRGVDIVTGATVTSNAIINATAKAAAQAKKK